MGKCVVMNIDVRETLQVLDDRIGSDEKTNTDKMSQSEVISQKKLESELENLRLESEFRLVQLENLKFGGVSTTNNVRLPKIKFPNFSGTVTEWPTFWDAFSSTIHKNTNLSKVDKFKYVMSCLVGEAKDTLNGFKIRIENTTKQLTYFGKDLKTPNSLYTDITKNCRIYREVPTILTSCARR